MRGWIGRAPHTATRSWIGWRSITQDWNDRGRIGLRLSGLALDMAAVPEMMTVAATTAIPWRIIAVSLATTRTFVARTISVRTALSSAGSVSLRGRDRKIRASCRNCMLRYRRCYLETHSSLEAACGLYRSAGFEFLDGPLPGGDHSAMDMWAVKEVNGNT